MRFSYIIYPEAKEILKKTGIVKRVDEIKQSEDGLPYLGGSIFSGEIQGIVKELINEGYYKNVPKDFYETYKKVLNGILNKPEEHFWTIKTQGGEVKEPCQLEDMMMFTGDLASLVLKPEEFWEYKKFGFETPSELITIVGTYIFNESRGKNDVVYDKGLIWTTNNKDGSKILTNITGDHNYDLRVFQEDVTHYKVIDPFGNPIRMRPAMSTTKRIMSAYHSEESRFLVALFKYIDQLDIPVDFKKDNAQRLIDWGRSFGQAFGATAQHLSPDYRDVESFFITYDIDIPRLNEENESEVVSSYFVGSLGEGSYRAYIDSKSNLVFSYITSENVSEKKRGIEIKFTPEDAEEAVKGVIYQCAKGLGRTSALQVLDLVQYKHSDKFIQDQKEIIEKYGKFN